MRRSFILLVVMAFALAAGAQTGLKKVYNDDINPMEQIDQAIAKAKKEGKFVICQVGGNWCPWCLRFADLISKDEAISDIISKNYEYIHVSYNPRRSSNKAKAEQSAALMKRLNNCARFGFPVFVVLNEEGKVIHIQDSYYLEKKGTESYDKEMVLRFFKNWTPQTVKR